MCVLLEEELLSVVDVLFLSKLVRKPWLARARSMVENLSCSIAIWCTASFG